jgi:DNA topoisomerase-1
MDIMINIDKFGWNSGDIELVEPVVTSKEETVGVAEGSAGSGNYNHLGIQGHQGGSLPKDSDAGYERFPGESGNMDMFHMTREMSSSVEKYILSAHGPISVPGEESALAATSYQGGYYNLINYHLRHPELEKDRYGAPIDPIAFKTIEDMDKILDKQSLQKPTVLYRGVKEGLFKALREKGAGTTYRDMGYSSTSISPRTAIDFSQHSYFMLEILAPKGTKAFNPDIYRANKYNPSKNSQNALAFWETEFVLDRGTKYEVVGGLKDRKVDGQNVLFLRVKVVDQNRKAKVGESLAEGGDGSGRTPGSGTGKDTGRESGATNLDTRGDSPAGGGVAKGFVDAKDKENLPKHIRKIRIPPAWTGVRFNPDPKGELLVVGKDAAGRDQYLYSEKFKKGQAREKFARIKSLEVKQAGIEKEIGRKMRSRDADTREAAVVSNLIMKTGLRPGSDEEIVAKVKSYGATTLEGRHVVQVGEEVRLQFIGKKGVAQDVLIEDKDIAKTLLGRKITAGEDGKLFSIDSGKLNRFVHTLNGRKFTTKDFRTLMGTTLAKKFMEKIQVPKTMKLYKKAVREVAKHVAARLGNTPTVALQAYISPTIFAVWRKGLA